MNKSLILSALLSLALHLFVLSSLFHQKSPRVPVNQENSVTLSFLEKKREEKEKKGSERKQEQQKRIKVQKRKNKQSRQTLQKTQKTLKHPKKPKRTKGTKPKKSISSQKKTKTTEETSPKSLQSNTPKKPSEGIQETEEKGKLQKFLKQEPPREGEERKEEKKEFERKKYISMLIAEIERRKFYPPIARRMGIEGVVRVKITLDRKGKLKEVKVTSSSGSKILDRATVKLMKRCHFPPLPPEYGKEKFSVEIPIRYTLK
jgi:protein TonB